MRQHRPQQKRTKQRVNPDPLRRKRRQQDRRTNRRKHPARSLPLELSLSRQPQHPRLRYKQHKQNVRSRPAQHGKNLPRLRPRHRHHKRQQTPRRHIVRRRACQRQHSRRTLLHPAIGQDPRQHRKRRNRHRNASKQRKRSEPNAAVRVTRIQPQRQRASQQKRHNNARMRNQNRSLRPPPQQLDVELHPNQEHVQHDADLRNHRQIRHNIARDQPRRSLRRKPSEKRRPQQNSRNNFAHYLRLPQPPKQRPH